MWQINHVQVATYKNQTKLATYTLLTCEECKNIIIRKQKNKQDPIHVGHIFHILLSLLTCIYIYIYTPFYFPIISTIIYVEPNLTCYI